MFGKKKEEVKVQEEKVDPTKPVPVSEEEMDIALDGPAIYSNKMYLNLGAGGLRVAFTEIREPSPPKFRTAVLLSLQDGLKLRDALTRVLTNYEKQMAELEPPEKSEPESGAEGDV